MTFKIESGVPVPPRTGRTIYPFREMKPGDSFALPLNGGGPAVQKLMMRRVISAAQTFTRRYGPHFTVRLVLDEGIIRVWRDKDETP